MKAKTWEEVIDGLQAFVDKREGRGVSPPHTLSILPDVYDRLVALAGNEDAVEQDLANIGVRLSVNHEHWPV